MNWISAYEDLSSKEKRKARQKVFKALEIKKTAFYTYLGGKQPRKLVSARIEAIINSVKSTNNNVARNTH